MRAVHDYVYIRSRVTSPMRLRAGRSTCIAERPRHTCNTSRRKERKIRCVVSRFLPRLFGCFSFFPFVFLRRSTCCRPTIVCIICSSRRAVDKSKRCLRHMSLLPSRFLSLSWIYCCQVSVHLSSHLQIRVTYQCNGLCSFFRFCYLGIGGGDFRRKIAKLRVV